MIKWKIRPTDNRKHKHLREGTEVYRHPHGYFIVLELEGKQGDKYFESFYPEQLIPVN